MKILNLIKNYVFYLIVVLFLEFTFAIVMPVKISGESVANILFFSILISSFLSMIGNIFKEKVNVVINSILLFIIGLLFTIQCVFYNSLKTYFALSNLGLSDQLADFAGQTISCIMKNIGFIVLFFLPFILYLIFHKKIKLKRNTVDNYIFCLVILVLFIPMFMLHVNNTKGRIHGTYELYHDVNEVTLNINKLGVLNSYTIDLFRTIFGFKTEIKNVDIDKIGDNKKKEEVTYTPNTLELDFDKETTNGNIKKINDYMKSISGTMKNKYTGMFEGYNLIYITAESFSEIGVSKELTPTLYKLTHSGFIFENYYTPYVLSTIGGEFQSMTGLYPDSSILPTWRSGENYFPYGLGTIFKGLNYETYAYHNHTYTFQDRWKYYNSQGLDRFKACRNGLENLINCKRWPESDQELINATFEEYANKTPFLTYMMTVSGHYEYDFQGNNSMSLKHKDKVINMEGLSEHAKAYVATQIELDLALESLLNKLEEKGILDNTVIVLLADHYPYELSLSDVNSLSSYTRDGIVEVNHNNLIIWNNKMENIHITKPCMSVDVLPTVYNLFGVEYDSRLLTGRDILSDSNGLVILKDHSWVTDKGTYFASSNKFVGDESVDQEYIKNINATVNNRLNISKLILSTDYYRYLLDN